MSPLDQIDELFSGDGARDYLGEEVTIAQHMRQAGSLAASEGAPPPLVAAALLHDVGHLRGTISGQDLMAGIDNRHGKVGAQWLSQWFGPEVCQPVGLHVAAKRYLCRVEPDYFACLSAASVFTLSVQGGPMTAEEVDRFEALPYAADAVAVRRWDDRAKDPSASAPELESFQPLLEALLRPA